MTPPYDYTALDVIRQALTLFAICVGHVVLAARVLVAIDRWCEGRRI